MENGVTALKIYPCYCGGEMEIKKVPQNGGMDGTYWNWELICKKCGLTMTYAADGFYGRKYKTFEEVVDDWNQKARDNMDGKTKDIMEIMSAVAKAPSECSECVAYCAEGRISCDCRGDFHPETCEYSSCYKESEEV